jgi:hypothetical protein
MDMDFCQISEGAGHPLVKMFLPDIRDSLGDLLHPCPYSVSLFVDIFFFYF